MFTYKTDRGAKYMPTPEEIAAHTRAIRDGWSDSERERRCVAPREPVQLKVCEIPIRMGAVLNVSSIFESEVVDR